MEMKMIRTLFAILFSVFLLMPAYSEDLSPADKSSVQAVIAGQLEAFKAGDGPKAYSYAAPFVTQVFPTVEVFMSMVKRGYEPIFRNTKYGFGTVTTDTLGRPTQHVTITAADGKRYEAVYAMQQQPDGSWKIAGVQMVEIPGVDA
jgi:ketosteroid isomerase-like protein